MRFDLERGLGKGIQFETCCYHITAFHDRNAHLYVWSRKNDPIHNLAVSGCQMPKALHIPVRRNLAQPLDAGVFHGNVRVEAPGNGAGDERGAFLLE